SRGAGHVHQNQSAGAADRPGRSVWCRALVGVRGSSVGNRSGDRCRRWRDHVRKREQMFDPNSYAPKHFAFVFSDKVATITLNRPERKNPLTFESYAELRDLFRDLVYAPQVKAVVIVGAGGNFCSGGDVHEI